MRIAVVRAIAASASWRRRPSSLISANPALKMMAAFTFAAAQASAVSTTAGAGTAMMAVSTGSGTAVMVAKAGISCTDSRLGLTG